MPSLSRSFLLLLHLLLHQSDWQARAAATWRCAAFVAGEATNKRQTQRLFHPLKVGLGKHVVSSRNSMSDLQQLS